jgi:hypothetical protein
VEGNVGWWVPVLVIAVPLLLLFALHLLARLESWMFAPDERAHQVARLLDEVDTPDEVEQEVSRLLAEVTDKPATAARPARVDWAEAVPRGPGRVDHSSFQDRSLRRLRLRRATARGTSDQRRK